MTRLTNAFSKKIENHWHALVLHFLYYNFVRIHKTVKVSPAMAAGVTKRLWEMKDVVDMLEAWEAAQARIQRTYSDCCVRHPDWEMANIGVHEPGNPDGGGNPAAPKHDIAAAINALGEKYEASQKDRPEHDRQTLLWAKRAGIGVGIYTLITLGIAIIALCQLQTARDTEMRQLRAYVGTGEISTIQQPKGIALQIANHGQTPAVDVKVFSNWTDFPADQGIPVGFRFPEENDCPKDVAQGGQGNGVAGSGVLFPNEPMNSVVQRPLQCPSQAKRILDAIAAKRMIILYGHIEYRDVFDQPRVTTFCINWVPDSSSTMCDRHNEIDPPKERR